MATHRAIKNANEPSWVATPMSIPFICRTATTQDAAASPNVAVSAAALPAVVALVRAIATPLFRDIVAPLTPQRISSDGRALRPIASRRARDRFAPLPFVPARAPRCARGPAAHPRRDQQWQARPGAW